MRPVAITRVGAVGPFGAGLDDFAQWWKAGRRPLVGPITTLKEPWLPLEQGCEVPFWKARAHLPDRKAIKLMTPRVQFGVAAALEAWGRGIEEADDVQPEPPPQLRGMYTGCGVPVDEDWTFREAIKDSIRDGAFDISHFGGPGQDLLNPLWLVKSLTNNVLAFTAKTLDLQGANDNFEGGAAGPLLALGSAARATGEGRLDRALAGGSDSLVTVEALLHLARHDALDGFVPSQGGAFVRLDPGRSGDFGVVGFSSRLAPCPPEDLVAAGLFPPPQAEHALSLASESAWKQARALGISANQAALIRSPHLPDGPGDVDLWSGLGDPGAAAGALLFAAAWALRELDGHRFPIELAAAGPGGEVAVALLATLP